MTVFESGTRVPLLFRDPSMPPAGYTTAGLAEAVDLFPTLVDLALGQPAPPYCDGTSLAPVIRNGSVAVKEAAFSEFVKCYSCCRVPDAQPCLPGGAAGRCPPANYSDLHEMGNCFHVPREQIDFIGYSARTSSWRYTEWMRFNGTALHGDFQRVVARELYDHRGDNDEKHNWDQFENENVANDPANHEVVQMMHSVLLQGFAPV